MINATGLLGCSGCCHNRSLHCITADFLATIILGYNGGCCDSLCWHSLTAHFLLPYVLVVVVVMTAGVGIVLLLIFVPL